MTQPLTEKLKPIRKVGLACLVACFIAAPALYGQSEQEPRPAQPSNAGPLPSFEVASVKPNRSGDGRFRMMNSPGRFSAINATPKMLIEFAYNLKDPQLTGGPSWIDSDHYDIDATTGESPDALRSNPAQANERRRLMMRSLLADRFKLTLNAETKDLPVYNLVVSKGGPKFHETKLPPIDPNAPPPPPPSGPPKPGQPFEGRGVRFSIGSGGGQLAINGGPMTQLADSLSRYVGRNVIDKTGLKGEYDLTLQWTSDENDAIVRPAGGGSEGRAGADTAPPPDSGPTIFTALQEQLGLKLESAKGPVATYAIVHIEQPSPN